MDVVRNQRNMAHRSQPDDGTDSTVDSNTTNEPVPNTSTTTTAASRRRGAPWQRLRKRRSSEAPESTDSGGHRLLEEHYRVDSNQRFLLPGVKTHDADWARDAHDFFNLFFLVPLVALNVMNWNWDLLLNWQFENFQDAWTGEYFDSFFKVTLAYFVADLLWIVLLPSCVKSPATIVQHHVATMLYILIPYMKAEYQWCMGACMIVEINTWFLIARRVFNKQGFPPWVIGLSVVSIRIKLISILFYITWIGIRCLLYPYLMVAFYRQWMDLSVRVGTKFNVLLLSVPLHACFCLLNLKWSYDLLMSKIRYWRRKGNYKDSSVSKGL